MKWFYGNGIYLSVLSHISERLVWESKPTVQNLLTVYKRINQLFMRKLTKVTFSVSEAFHEFCFSFQTTQCRRVPAKNHGAPLTPTHLKNLLQPKKTGLIPADDNHASPGPTKALFFSKTLIPVTNLDPHRTSYYKCRRHTLESSHT